MQNNFAKTLLVIFFTAVVAGISCSSGTKTEGSEDVVATEIESSTATVHTVVIKNMVFTPDTLIVRKGDTVEWVNEDIFAHDVTASDDRSTTSGLLMPKDRFSIVIDSTFDYLCSIHPTMVGFVQTK